MRRKIHTKSIVAYTLIAVVLASAAYLYAANRSVNADLTSEIKKSEGMNAARFQINPVSSWNTPAKITFRVAAARWMFYGSSGGAPVAEQNPKITGRFFCNKPFVPGYNYPTGLYEPPDAIFQDGAPFPPTDVMDGHNGMTYTYLLSENYEQSLASFFSTTVPTTYQTTCTYNQPGEYWPLFYADGLSAWYTQKIIVTGAGYTVTSTPTVVPSPSPTSTLSTSAKELVRAGFTVIGFNQAVQTSVYANNGIDIFNYNKTSKTWDKISSGEYLFDAYKAYYLYTPTDKYVDRVSLSPSPATGINVTDGWNFVWVSDLAYLGNISVTYRSASGQCIAQNMSLRNLRDNNLVYKWIYNVVDDKATAACQAFALLTGRDQSYTGCTLANPLLNEQSYAKARSGLWIYVWPNKTQAWLNKPSYPCN